METSTIDIGAEVRSTDGVVGIVAGLDQLINDKGDTEGALVIRARTGTEMYRVPADLIKRAARSGDKTIVVLDVSTRALKDYLSSDQSVPDPDVSTAAGQQSQEWDAQWGRGELVIPLVAEELTAETRPRYLGSVHIHKGVASSSHSLTLPVVREEAVIEHIAPDQYDASAPLDPDETVIPIIEEQIVLEKRRVVREYIRIRKQRISEDQVIQDTVRHEFVEVRELPDADGTTGTAPLFRVVQGRA